MDLNYSIVPARPAGGAWTSARDLLRYVQMEAREWKAPQWPRARVREEPAGAAREAGRDRRDRSLRDGTLHGPEVERHRHSSRRQHDWLQERYGDASRAWRWCRDSDQCGYRLRAGQRVRPPVARGSLRWQAGSDGEPAHGLEELEDGSCEGAGTPSRPARSSGNGEARSAIPQRCSGRHHRAHDERWNHLRFRRVEECGRVAEERRRDLSFRTIDPGGGGFGFVVAGNTLVLRDGQHEYVLAPQSATSSNEARR